MEEKSAEKSGKETENSKNRKAIIWISAIAAAAFVIGVFMFSSEKNGDLPESARNSLPADPLETAASENVRQNPEVFDISGKPFEFSVKEIRVKRGSMVRINFTSAQGMHNWVIDEFNAKTKIVQAGQSDSIEFIADKAGTFEYYCSVPTHRQQGMVGRLIVE